MTKNNDKRENKHKRELLSVLRSAAKDTKILDAFLIDILSPREYLDVAKRLQIVKELKKGVSHRKIAASLGVGVATVERGVRMLQNKNGGFNKVL